MMGQRLSTAPERLCSARFCAPSALRPPGGPQTLTLLPPAGPSTPQPLLAVPRCASAPAKHGAAEDSWPIRDTTTFSPGVCPLMSRQLSHLLRLALPTAVSGRQMEDHPTKRRMNLDSFVSFSQKPELRWFRVARLAVCSISSLAQIERLRLRRCRHRLLLVEHLCDQPAHEGCPARTQCHKLPRPRFCVTQRVADLAAHDLVLGLEVYAL